MLRNCGLPLQMLPLVIASTVISILKFTYEKSRVDNLTTHTRRGICSTTPSRIARALENGVYQFETGCNSLYMENTFQIASKGRFGTTAIAWAFATRSIIIGLPSSPQSACYHSTDPIAKALISTD